MSHQWYEWTLKKSVLSKSGEIHPLRHNKLPISTVKNHCHDFGTLRNFLVYLKGGALLHPYISIPTPLDGAESTLRNFLLYLEETNSSRGGGNLCLLVGIRPFCNLRTRCKTPSYTLWYVAKMLTWNWLYSSLNWHLYFEEGPPTLGLYHTLKSTTQTSMTSCVHTCLYSSPSTDTSLYLQCLYLIIDNECW